MKVTMYFRIAIICIMSLTYLSSVNAQQTPDKVVKDFGEALSSLCETKNFAYREKIKALCSGKKSCRVENKMHTEYQKKRGLTGYETFVLESYLGMFKELIHNGVDYQMYNVKLEHSDMMPDGLLSFVTADVKVSGPVNKTETNLFLVRDDKISGIYSYSSKLGFSHLNGSLIKAIELGRYTWTSGFRNGYAIVENEGGNYGLIDLKGDVIIPCMWDGIIYEGGAAFATGFDIESKLRVTYDLRKNGKRVPLYGVNHYNVDRFAFPIVFSEGWAVVHNEDNKYGFLKEDWEESEYDKIKYIYDGASRFVNGFAYVKCNGLGFILNEKFRIVLCDDEKYHIVGNVRDGLVEVKDKSTGKIGFMNVLGEVVIPCIYFESRAFINGLVLVYKSPYFYINDKEPNIGLSALRGPLKLIDNHGRTVWDSNNYFARTYDDFYNGHMIVYKEDEEHKGKYLSTFIGLDGKPLPGFKWDNHYILHSLREGYALFNNDSIFGYYDEYGEVAIDLSWKYTHASDFVNGIAWVGIRYGAEFHEVKWGCINKEGINIIPCVYDEETMFNENGIALVRKDGRIGLIDVYGNSTFFHGHISKEDNINKE